MTWPLGIASTDDRRRSCAQQHQGQGRSNAHGGLMRLWSLHPRYLDAAGLVALWREALLAQAVLWRTTRGYRHHPQLQRFRQHPDPLQAIAAYLDAVWQEAAGRGYRFDRAKIVGEAAAVAPIVVTRGQLEYEKQWLQEKLRRRAPQRARTLEAVDRVEAHPLFAVVEGPVADWERPKDGPRETAGAPDGAAV